MPQESKESERDDDDLLQVLDADEPALLGEASGKSSKSYNEKLKTPLEEVEEEQSDEDKKEEKTIFDRESVYEKSSWLSRIFYTWTFDVIAASKQRKLTKEDFGGINEEDTIDEKVKQITDIYDN
jgi:hypothetical protein